MSMRRSMVQVLNSVCVAVDAILYLPGVVRLGRRAPRWWNCQLAKVSLRLDQRWGTGFWEDGPAVPGPPCKACGRRAAHLTVEVWSDERLFDKVDLCGWCELDPEAVIHSPQDLNQALMRAGERSMEWRWR